MNILQVCAYAAPYEGNFIKSLKLLDNVLLSDGNHTIYAFPETARNILWCKELQKNRTVYFLPLNNARINLKLYLKLSAIIKNENINIIHSHFELYDLPLSVVTNKKKCKLFWHLHDALADKYPGFSISRKLLFKLQYKWFSNRVKLISVSKKHLDFVIDAGFKKKNAIIVFNGVDTSALIKKNRETLYDFIVFAWDYKRKGADIVIEASKKLYKEGYSFSVGFVGNQALWNNSDIVSVKNKPWFKKQDFVEDVLDLYNSTKCFLHVSRSEGCSYALLEAAYLELPVISSDIDENLVLKCAPDVTFVKNESVEDLSEAMKKMIDIGFCLKEKDKMQTKKIICDEFSLEAWVNQIVDIYYH